MLNLHNGILKPIHAVGKRNVFRTNIIASATSYAHMVSIALLVIQNLMQYLETHTLAVFLPAASTAGYVGKTVYHTRGPDAAAFACLAVFAVE